MIKRVFWSSYTIVGILMLILGLIIGFAYEDFPLIAFDNKVRIFEVLNLLLTLCIAISIPFIVKKTIDDKRAVKAFLTEEVKETLSALCKIRDVIKDAYIQGTISRDQKDILLRDFNSLELKLNSLNEQLEVSFKSESVKMIGGLKEAYFQYDGFVTGDDLMCETYDKIDAGFFREHKSLFYRLELQLKKAIQEIHCY
jgi:hypothetical protein